MTRLRRIEIQRVVAAPPERVFSVLADHVGYVALMPGIRSVRMEALGAPDPRGVGAVRAVRVLTPWGPTVREQIIDFACDERLGYRITSGLPVREHTGIARLTPLTAGTRLDYCIQTRPLAPGVFTLLRLGARRLVAGIADAAEKQAIRN